MTGAAKHADRSRFIAAPRGRPGTRRLAHDGREDLVDGIAEQDHLARDDLLALGVGGEVVAPILLHVTVAALDAQ